MSTNEQQARELADRVRRDHGLGQGPIKDLYELAHTVAGVDVASLDAGQSEHGLMLADPETGGRAIGVATTDHPMRQRSTIAHELGHLLFEDGNLTPGERSPEEIRADAFARHLLLPLDAVRLKLSNVGGEATQAHLSDLVQEYELSPHMAAIQMREAGFISEATCAAWRNTATAFLATTYGWLDQYRALVAEAQMPRTPQNLMQRAIEGYHQGMLSLVELAFWYRMEPAELLKVIGPPRGADDQVDDSSEEDWEPVNWDVPTSPGAGGMAPAE